MPQDPIIRAEILSQIAAFVGGLAFFSWLAILVARHWHSLNNRLLSLATGVLLFGVYLGYLRFVLPANTQTAEALGKCAICGVLAMFAIAGTGLYKVIQRQFPLVLFGLIIVASAISGFLFATFIRI